MIRMLLLLITLFGLAYGTTVAHAAETIPPANQLTTEQVELAAGVALVGKGAGDSVRAQLIGNREQVFYEGVAAVEPRFTGLNFDKSTGKWSANLIIGQGEKILKAVPVGGKYEEMTTLPVLKRQLRNGDTIAADDIDWLDFPLARTRSDVVTDAQQLVGQSPRGSISPKRPIRAHEIASPALVMKNKLVTMRYVSGNMEITTSGVALANGAKGDVVQIRNVNSKAVVQAVVDDANTVTIVTATTRPQLAGDPYALAN